MKKLLLTLIKKNLFSNLMLKFIFRRQITPQKNRTLSKNIFKNNNQMKRSNLKNIEKQLHIQNNKRNNFRFII